MKKPLKYDKAITIKIPKVVYEAAVKRAEQKQKWYGRYRAADVVRTALIKHLKQKGFLEKGKDYL